MRFRALTIVAGLLIGILIASTAVAQPRAGERAGPAHREVPAQREAPAQREGPMQRDRPMQHERERVQDPARHAEGRQPLHVQDRERLRDRDVYGSRLMSRAERRQYREQIRDLQSERDWARFRLEHQREMQRRAAERGVDLPPPLFGQQLMTDAERVRLQAQLRNARDDAARQRIRSEHEQRIRERARTLGIPEADLAAE